MRHARPVSQSVKRLLLFFLLASTAIVDENGVQKYRDLESVGSKHRA